MNDQPKLWNCLYLSLMHLKNCEFCGKKKQPTNCGSYGAQLGHVNC